MRMQGSVFPAMILPLTFVGVWSTLITCLCRFVHDLSVNDVLLTVLGFVVGLALSFRTSASYERYSEGRKYWASLQLASHNLARVIWTHASEREGEIGKEDLLTKISGLNLILAFAVALKHKLRYEPYTYYEDLNGLVGHLQTFAKAATTPDVVKTKKHSMLRRVGQYLGVSFAEANPRKVLKRSPQPLGNLPLEILSHLGSYLDEICENGTLKQSIHQVSACTFEHIIYYLFSSLTSKKDAALSTMNEVLIGCERILNTPLPIAYCIAIDQICWVYVILLPFQLYTYLHWVTIPGAVFAAYIIIGLMLIGREIEDPFGYDTNDLPLDLYCQELANEIDVIASQQKPNVRDFVKHEDNKVLFPIHHSGYHVWEKRSELRIRDELRMKVHLGVPVWKSMHVEKSEEPKGEKSV